MEGTKKKRKAENNFPLAQLPPLNYPKVKCNVILKRIKRGGGPTLARGLPFDCGEWNFPPPTGVDENMPIAGSRLPAGVGFSVVVSPSTLLHLPALKRSGIGMRLTIIIFAQLKVTAEAGFNEI